MAKIPVKKTASDKGKKSAAKKSVKSKLSPAKKKPAKKSSVKKAPVKKTITPKERELREANLIANTEKKKKVSPKRPRKTSSPKETTGLLDSIVEGMKERKGKNIMILDLAGIENRVTDYFVICDADSNTHVNSIADSIEETVSKLTNERAYHTEGHQNGEWILIDYINIVVHVFLRETREHYNIEGLWGDADITLIND
jgi:ribosome-associated protein